jgi:ribose transport system ATP-binding protein
VTLAAAADAPAALDVRGLIKRFPGVLALDAVDLSLAAGEVHAVAGENGAGKSSLIKLLGGTERPDGGQMRLGGQPYAPRSPLDAMRAGIRVVHQELQMLDQLSVAENLLFDALPRRVFGLVDRQRLAQRAKALLAMVGLHDLDPARRVQGLGMAQRQLIEIAKALSADCRILILDEPTATLTTRETDRLFTIVRQLRAAGVAVLFVSHHLQELFEIADQVTVLRNGRKVATRPIADTSPDGLVRLMVGRDVAAAAGDALPQRGGAPPLEALRVEGLRFSGQSDNAAIDLAVQHGEILGIAGLVGSGRTETLRAICGVDRRIAGRIFRDSREVTIAAPRDALAAGICLVTEDRKDEGLVLDMPIRANVTLATLRRHARSGWIRRAAEAVSTRRMVGDLDIRSAGIEQHPRELSGGNQQKVVLAKWLLARPQVLILDEPTRGVDVGAKAEIHAVLRRVAEQGMAVIIVSSDLPELLSVSHRIAVLSKGRLAGEVAREAFDEQSILQMAYREYLRTEDDAAAVAA